MATAVAVLAALAALVKLAALAALVSVAAMTAAAPATARSGRGCHRLLAGAVPAGRAAAAGHAGGARRPTAARGSAQGQPKGKARRLCI